MGVAGREVGKGEGMLSEMGSKERENVELDALEVTGDCMSGSCIWPSNTDCFRACGWFGGNVGDRPNGDCV